MKTIYDVLPAHFIHVEIAISTGSFVYENGILKMNFEIPLSVEELDEKIAELVGVRDNETGDQPQHCLDAIQYLHNLKQRLGWQ